MRIRQNKLAWVFTALKVFYTRTIGDFIIGVAGLFVTGVICLNAPFLIRELSILVYLGYNFRNYAIGNHFMETVYNGANKVGYDLNTLDNLFKTPWDYPNELQQLYDYGAGLRSL